MGEVPLACTPMVPTMNWCRSHWNLYVPGVLNVQVPLHPATVGRCGSGGTEPLPRPAVCVHELGLPEVKSALCSLNPMGYENETVPPCAMVIVVPPPPAVQAKSVAVNVPVVGKSADADDGTKTSAPANAPAMASEIALFPT